MDTNEIDNLDFDSFFAGNRDAIPSNLQSEILKAKALEWFTEKIEKNGFKVTEEDFDFEDSVLQLLGSIDDSLKDLVKYFATKEALEKGKTKVEVTINEPKYVTGDDDGKYTVPTMMQRGLTLLSVLLYHLAETEGKEKK